MNERTGNILMRKIFTEPTKPEELYEFFTYGLPQTPLDWTLRWHPNAVQNTIRRKLWYVKTILHSDSVIVNYQPTVKKSDNSWYLFEWKYLPYVHE